MLLSNAQDKGNETEYGCPTLKNALNRILFGSLGVMSSYVEWGNDEPTECFVLVGFRFHTHTQSESLLQLKIQYHKKYPQSC